MNILVVFKQVPYEQDTYQDTGFLNDSDINVLMHALDLRDAYGGSVSVMVIGPKDAVCILKEAHTYGLKEAYLLSDAAWEHADIPACANLVAEAVRYMGNIDVVLFGRQAIDGDSVHMAAMTACALEWQFVAYAKNINLVNANGHEQLIAECVGDETDSIQKTQLPTVFVSIRGKVKGHIPTVANIMKAYDGRVKIEILDSEILNSSASLQLPKTACIKTYALPQNQKTECVLLEGNSQTQKANQFINMLADMGITIHRGAK